MKVSFTAPIKAFSINKWLNTQKRLTQDARIWKQETITALRAFESQLQPLREFFNPKLHYYTLNIICFYPKELYWTKDKRMNQHIPDTSNVIKTLEDLLYGQDNYGDTFNTFKNLNSNDAYVKRSSSEKAPSEDGTHSIRIDIEIHYHDSLQS